MKSILCIVISFLCVTPSLSGQETDLAQQLKQTLEQDVANRQFAGGVAGVSVGDETLVVTAGLRAEKSEAPFERLTLSRIASVSK